MPRTKREEHIALVEEKEAFFEIATDQRTREVLFNLCHQQDLKESYAGKLARKVWDVMRSHGLVTEEAQPLKISQEQVGISAEEWRALEYAMEEERIRAGEQTPRVQEFIESRKQLDNSLRLEREKLGREYIKVDRELMLEKDKGESALYKELSEIVQNVSRELGFERPVDLDVVRDEHLNAFVLTVSKEGGLSKENTIPLRIYVNAGLIDVLRQAFNPKEYTLGTPEEKLVGKDHVAAVIAHELAHLKQPAWHADMQQQSEEQSQRYEYDADSEGMRAMDRAGYNPKAMIEVFETMHKMQRGKLQNLLGHYLSGSHPLTENRIKELWQLFQQPDQPYFSAQKNLEPLSSTALKEVDGLLRKELYKEIAEARTLADWEKIIERLEKGDGMTLRDTEIVGQNLKLFMDGRLAMAVALEELATGTGMAEALLYRANHLMHERKKFDEEAAQVKVSEPLVMDPPAPKRPPQYAMRDVMGCGSYEVNSTVFGYLQKWTTSVMPLQPRDYSREEYSPALRDKEVEGQAVKFIKAHTANEVVPPDYFKTIDDLFDPENSHASMFWESFVDVKHSFELNARVKEPSSLLDIARRTAELAIAGNVCFGVYANRTYEDEAIDEKKKFLEFLASAEKDSAGPETSGAFIDDQLQKIKQAISGRVAVYKEHTPVSVPKVQIPEKRKRREGFSFRREVMRCPSIVPEAAFSASEPVELESLTPLQRIVTRYFKGAHKIFDRTLSPEFIKQEYAVATVENPKVQQQLFEDLFRDFFFEPGRSSPRRIDADHRPPELLTYLRFTSLTAHALNGDPGSPVAKHINRRVEYSPSFNPSLQKFCIPAKDEKLTLTSFGQYLENLRLVRNQNGLSMQGPNTFGVKVNIFTQLARQGIVPDQVRVADSLESILIAQAEAKGLPREFWLAFQTTDTRGRIKKMLGIGGPKRVPLTNDMARTVNTLFSQEFMRLLADDRSELSQCSTNTIKVVDLNE